MKWQLIILMILCASVVFADNGMIKTYSPNEVFDLSVHLTNLTGDVLGANCSAQIRLANFSVKEDLYMTEIGMGWYNATYNTSDVGKYFCRSNCTLGEQYTAGSCDFNIEQEDNMLLGVIVLIPILIMFSMLFIAWLLPGEKYPALKIGLILTSFVFIFQAYQFATVALGSTNGTDMIDVIGDNVLTYSWIYGIFFAVIMLTFVYDIFMMFSGKKHKTGVYDDDEER